MQRVVVTDCGSTTTKALLFEKQNGSWHFKARGEAPTTVEQPVADVTVGVVNAFRELEELSGISFLNLEQDIPIVTDIAERTGINCYLSTSSAGGGLQMMVAGLVGKITTESAQRAALGAGAIVVDSISADDGRDDHERIERIRALRPDIFLLCGGVDGGAISQVVETAELLLAASPRPRFGDTLKLPIIFAGNCAATDEIKRILAPLANVTAVKNVRPELDREDLDSAREAIHEFFLSHVMSHSPGYAKLMGWTSKPISPTPVAVGLMVDLYARKKDEQVIAVDIGGATTDVFSSCIKSSKDSTATDNSDQDKNRILTRTVSANLGMSYSIGNVVLEAGISAIARWLPFLADLDDIKNRLRNKMIRPTTIPQTLEDLWLEQAVCREALRLSFAHHRSLAVAVSEGGNNKEISDAFNQNRNTQLIEMFNIDTVIGSGGVLSHAPNRSQAALMLIDGFQVEGVTRLMVDSVFMLPHLGIFSSIEPVGAEEILERDCLVHLGYCIAPIFSQKNPTGTSLGEVTVESTGETFTLSAGTFFKVPILDEETSILLKPSSAVDLGIGPGRSFKRKIKGGGIGLIIDCRGRPIQHAQTAESRVDQQLQIMKAMSLENK